VGPARELAGRTDAASRAVLQGTRWTGPLLACAVCVAYVGLAAYVVTLHDPVDLGAGFWPAAGVSLAALLLTPTRRWAWILGGVALAELGNDLAHGYPLAPTLWWTAANTIEPLVGAALVRRFGDHRGALSPLRHLCAFVAFGVVVGPLVGGTIGTIGTVSGLGLPVWQVWPKFVVGDALGALVVAPVLLTWRAPRPIHRSWAEVTALAALLVTVTLLVFRNWTGSWDVTLPYLLVPLLTWAALRHGVRGTAWSIFLVAQIANWATASGYGPFAIAGGPEGHAVTLLQIYLGITAGAALVVAALVSELHTRAEVELMLARQAGSDQLTGLPNRWAFERELDRAIAGLRRGGGPLAVLFCDLDRFKRINDSLGHRWGDAVLVEVARRLREAARPTDVVARFGGDELVVLCRDLHHGDDATGIARRLLHVLEEPFRHEGRSIALSASIGVVITDDPTAEPEALLRDADTAMYRAKEQGPGRFEHFDEGLRRRSMERLALEEELREALAAGQLRLHYQPVVALASGTIVGAEALLRWDHPVRGLLTPGAFLDVAEESGLIGPIGEWALTTAIRACARWPRGTFVAVNVSPRQLDEASAEGLPSLITGMCARVGLDPARVWLEVVEDALRDEVTARTILAEVQAAGVRLAVDDFGTGYASLARLRALPFDVCKIDRAFTALLGASSSGTTMLRAITELAHAHAMTVVAEGVEDDRQLEQLRRLGCDLAQGYHLHPPMPPEALDALLAAPVTAAPRPPSSSWGAALGGEPPDPRAPQRPISAGSDAPVGIGLLPEVLAVDEHREERPTGTTVGPVWTWIPATDACGWSSGWSALLGRGAEEMPSTLAGTLALVDPADRRCFARLVDQLSAGLDVGPATVRFRTDDGRTTQADVLGSRVRGDGEERVVVLCLGTG
jgi:diguanylate cyclase (GGDEF)-like protein